MITYPPEMLPSPDPDDDVEIIVDGVRLMKLRRHHNNKGHRQIKRGKTWDQVRLMALRLGIPFGQRRTPSARAQRDESE